MTVSDVTQRFHARCRPISRRTSSSASCSRAGARRISSRARSRRARARRAVRVLRGAADGERQAGHPSRVRAHDQGSLLPPSRDEGLSRAAQGGLGHARPAGRDRSREAARHQRQAGDREARRGRVQPAVPRERVHVSRRVGAAERAHRLLARLRAIRTSRTRNDYVESVWWALATLFEKGLLYRGHKILPYCARCGTALSSHEVAQGYEDVEDPSVYVALDLGSVGGEVVDDADGMPGRTARRILVWTTTPWTLVSNAALAVHPELDVRRAAEDGQRRTRARSSWPRRARGAVLGEDYATRWTQRGHADRRGARRRALSPSARLAAVSGGDEPRDHRRREFVSADDGSGVVHMSPAFGADDYAAGRRHNLAFLQPVDGARRVLRRRAARRRPVREGRRSRAHRGAEAARRAVEGGHA